MKRMSEVFELPVSGVDIQGSGIYFDQQESDRLVDDAIAHSINHVDALADALELLFDDYKELADSGDAGNWKLEETDVGMKAMAALAAYRGEK
jgi:hypothetical protein